MVATPAVQGESRAHPGGVAWRVGMEVGALVGLLHSTEQLVGGQAGRLGGRGWQRCTSTRTLSQAAAPAGTLLQDPSYMATCALERDVLDKSRPSISKGLQSLGVHL